MWFARDQRDNTLTSITTEFPEITLLAIEVSICRLSALADR